MKGMGGDLKSSDHESQVWAAINDRKSKECETNANGSVESKSIPNIPKPQQNITNAVRATTQQQSRNNPFQIYRQQSALFS
jgi:head-tail adaptor